jgi:cytochrome c oxidase subunit 2
VNDLMRRVLFLPPQGSASSVGIDHLHYFVILTTFFVSTVIGILALYFMAHYRRRRDEQATPHIESPLWLEALFVGVPLAFFLLWFRIGFGQFIEATTPPRSAMDVYVTAKQWMWQFAYPSGPNGLNVLRVPSDQPVRLLLTSRDVIHSFFVPAFRVKQDVLPGRYTQTWFVATKPGRYPVYCSQYCGTNHSYMRAEVVVMPLPEFEHWRDEERRGRVQQRDTSPEASGGEDPSTDMVAQGRTLAGTAGCLKCHTIDGTPHIGPSWRDLYGKVETLEGGSKVLVDEGYITESMMDPGAKQVAGFRLVMPSFLGKLQPSETAALVEYIRSLRTSVEAPPSGKPIYELPER